jgi:hypothetical protein
MIAVVHCKVSNTAQEKLFKLDVLSICYPVVLSLAAFILQRVFTGLMFKPFLIIKHISLLTGDVVAQESLAEQNLYILAQCVCYLVFCVADGVYKILFTFRHHVAS